MKKKVIVLIPIIFILGYILYKSCLLLYFRDLNGYSTDYKSVIMKEKKVDVDKSLANTKIDDINLYIPSGLDIEKENRDGYYRYISKSEVTGKTIISLSVAKSAACYEAWIDENKVMQTIGYKKLMDKNNMKSDRDLIKYYYTSGMSKNIFTSTNDIKLSYLSEMCAKSSTINGEGEDRNYYFSGDLDGTMYTELDRSYYIKVYNESKEEYYWISLYDYSEEDEKIITKEVFDMLLHSIYFD